MKCLLCDYKNSNDEVLKEHYINLHMVKKDNYFFNELFTKDFGNKHSRTYVACGDLCQACRKKKNHCFLMHYKQSGGSQTLPLPINISRRGNVLTIYSINYFIHRNSYDFYNAVETVKKFISAVNKNFLPGVKVKVQGGCEILNYQLSQDENIEQEYKRTWLTEVFTCIHFHRYIQNEITNNFMKRVTVNSLTGSSWKFKRFHQLSVIVTAASNLKSPFA